jgi:sulfur-carrier protein
MPVVRLRGPLKRLADDQAELALEGGSVEELLRELERTHPGTSGWILDERGVLRRHLAVFVNGDLCTQETPVESDDRVDVLPALSGGAG